MTSVRFKELPNHSITLRVRTNLQFRKLLDSRCHCHRSDCSNIISSHTDVCLPFNNVSTSV